MPSARGAAVILVGHVTKDGQIAGPRVVEHMVDAVLSFEGEGAHQFRILRAVKNRFGPTDEIGVFEMTGAGLARGRQSRPQLFLSERDLGSPGTAVFAGIEGTRPLLVEIQALVAPTSLGTPRRAVVGWDPNRLSMVLAVLEAHCGVRLRGHDVYLNVAGGLRIQEPAADLAAAAALVSSLANAPLPADAVYFGEVSLSGVVRPVAQSAGAPQGSRRSSALAAPSCPETARAEVGEPSLRHVRQARSRPLVRHRQRGVPIGIAGLRKRADKTGDRQRSRRRYTRRRAGAAAPIPCRLLQAALGYARPDSGSIDSGRMRPERSNRSARSFDTLGAALPMPITCSISSCSASC